MAYRQLPLHDGPDGMDHMVAGKIVCGRDLGLSRRLLVSLLFHELSTSIPKLDACIGMDAIVDTAMAGLIAARHAGVCGVDDCVTDKRCDVWD